MPVPITSPPTVRSSNSGTMGMVQPNLNIGSNFVLVTYTVKDFLCLKTCQECQWAGPWWQEAHSELFVCLDQSSGCRPGWSGTNGYLGKLRIWLIGLLVKEFYIKLRIDFENVNRLNKNLHWLGTSSSCTPCFEVRWSKRKDECRTWKSLWL